MFFLGFLLGFLGAGALAYFKPYVVQDVIDFVVKLVAKLRGK